MHKLQFQIQVFMIVKTAISVLFLFSAGIENLFSQTFIQPNYALKSHETLEITQIETTQEKTIISLSVENRITGGAFCADRNIFILYPDGTRSKLTSAAGIPACPEYYKFKTIGEKLGFVLTFPPLKAGTEWIDIVEDCSDNCFSFYGVILDNDLNKKIEEAYIFAEKGETNKAIAGYKSILAALIGRKHGIEGSLYTNIITLSLNSGDDTGAHEWYVKMVLSKAPRLDLFIKHLNSQGIRY
jgi:hypothetical protein